MTALVDPCRPKPDMRLQQELALVHQPEHPLVVDRFRPGSPARAIQQSRDPPVAVGGSCIGKLADG